MDLFKSIPKVTYNGVSATNLLAKIGVVKKYLSRYDLYYPYSVRDGERPDTIAYDYYGNSEYAWLVLIVNEIYDPYYGWPLTDRQFHDYLRAKYGAVYELKSQIKHYGYTGIDGNTQEEIRRLDFPMSITTWNSLDAEAKSGWTPVYVYDWEAQRNEDKRSIRLLSNSYLKQVDRELIALFNER